MVEEACACDQGLGLAHSHIWRPVSDGARIVMQDDGSIRLWVDWKQVARGLLREGGGRE